MPVEHSTMENRATIKSASLRAFCGQYSYLPSDGKALLLCAAVGAKREIEFPSRSSAYTDCLKASALQRTVGWVDLKDDPIKLEGLKERQRCYFDCVPVPSLLLEALNTVFVLDAEQKRDDPGRGVPASNVARNAACKHFDEAIVDATSAGSHAMLEGLRHGLGIRNVMSGVPRNTLGQPLDHPQLSITAIYADATGPEKRPSVGRMWP